MTGPLNNLLTIGDRVHIKVDDNMKECFFPEFLHDIIGSIWDLDDEHIWIKSDRTDDQGRHYISGPHRYSWMDITIAPWG